MTPVPPAAGTPPPPDRRQALLLELTVERYTHVPRKPRRQLDDNPRAQQIRRHDLIEETE